jgi:hypothetical protein
MCEDAQGRPQDHAEAIKWYLRAADQGYALGHFHLGMMSASGKGTPKDTLESCARFTLAAAMGHEKSRKMMEQLQKKMPPDFLEKARKRSQEMLREADERTAKAAGEARAKKGARK